MWQSVDVDVVQKLLRLCHLHEPIEFLISGTEHIQVEPERSASRQCPPLQVCQVALCNEIVRWSV